MVPAAPYSPPPPMTELSKLYDPTSIEPQITQKWLEAKAFAATPDERDGRYVIMMPLPNVTGALHMGHAMDNVMQDLAARDERDSGRTDAPLTFAEDAHLLDTTNLSIEAAFQTAVDVVEGAKRL